MIRDEDQPGRACICSRRRQARDLLLRSGICRRAADEQQNECSQGEDVVTLGACRWLAVRCSWPAKVNSAPGASPAFLRCPASPVFPLEASLQLVLFPISSIVSAFSTQHRLLLQGVPTGKGPSPFLTIVFSLLLALKQAIPWHAQPGKASAFSSFGLFSFASSFDVGHQKVEPQPHVRCADRQSTRPTRAIEN